jgi:predicted XRE-type DNA-binding protein
MKSRIVQGVKVQRSSGNVFADLGLPNADEMQVKATLAAKIAQVIQRRQLTQMQAAEVLFMPQPKLSGMLRGQFRGISEAKMLECLNRLGHDVQIVVRKPSRSKPQGRTTVVFA